MQVRICLSTSECYLLLHTVSSALDFLCQADRQYQRHLGWLQRGKIRAHLRVEFLNASLIYD